MKKAPYFRQILQSSTVLALCMVVLSPCQVNAERLPSMDKEPWMGFFSGYERRGFEFGVNDEGQCEIYLMDEKRKERIGFTRTIKIYPELLVESESGSLSTKRLKDDEGFATDMKPGLDHKEVQFTAESTGDAKVEITVKYDRDRIIMDGRILDRGTLKTGKLYLVFKVSVPQMHSKSLSSADAKEVKSMTRRDKVKFVRAEDKKRVSLKVYEDVDLRDEDKAKGGVTELVVDTSAQEGKVFTFTTLDGSGAIDFENRSTKGGGPLWKGYYVKWKREYTEDGAAGSATDKSKKAKGIAPFVIEIK